MQRESKANTRARALLIPGHACAKQLRRGHNDQHYGSKQAERLACDMLDA
jgi:hypothetical protein